MSCITRRIVGSAAASASGIVSILIVRRTQILAVAFSFIGVAAAAVDGRGWVEISKVNVVSGNVNDTVNTIALASWNAPIASAAIDGNSYVSTGGIVAEAGDYLYLHAYVAGTAPTALTVLASVYITE